MPRCITCNYCPETDGNDHRSFRYRDSIGGDVCGKCDGFTNEIRQEFFYQDEETSETSFGFVLGEFDDLGIPDILGDDDMGGDKEDDAG